MNEVFRFARHSWRGGFTWIATLNNVGFSETEDDLLRAAREAMGPLFRPHGFEVLLMEPMDGPPERFCVVSAFVPDGLTFEQAIETITVYARLL